MSSADANLSDCGCCDGVAPLTPRDLYNRPGEYSLSYRVGTHGAFKSTMLGHLAGEFRLRSLGTRQDDDPSIALIDAWSVTLDVLAFYQERIANEGFLRTAAERRSVLELARAIGYELRPGVAAATHLAFTVDNVPGGPTEATIAVGTKTQSIPGQYETPQLFETVESIAARAAWNAMPARLSTPFVPAKGRTVLYLQGANLNLKPGDALLVVDKAVEGTKWSEGDTTWDLRRITRVEELGDKFGVKTTTRVTFAALLNIGTPSAANVYVFRQRAAVFGYNAPDYRLFSGESRENFKLVLLEQAPAKEAKLIESERAITVTNTEWPDFKILTPGTDDTIDLDLVYPKVLEGSWLVLSQPNAIELFQVKDVVEASRADFGLTSKTTRVTLLHKAKLDAFKNSVRTVTVFAEPEQLTLAAEPLTTPVEGALLWLNVLVPTLAADRSLAVTGEDLDSGLVRSEIRTVKSVAVQQGTTRIELTKPLSGRFKRETVSVNANVAAATQGETKTEVLGNGDGSQQFQSFALTFRPLTHLSSVAASGAASTLEVRVNDVLWHEAASFHGLGPHDRRYIKRIDNDGAVAVAFGDGRTGARLPSGTQNVVARYRAGQGLQGLVQAGQISLLLTRPLGVNAVVNPVAPSGAADAEMLEDARRNAPLTILTLDRIVSLQDYEDFAHGFAGVGKAQARLLWDGGQQLIHITLAAADGGPFPEDSQPFANLLAAIDQARHAAHRVVANSYQALSFELDAEVLVAPDYQSALVLEAARNQLISTFAPLARSLGQGVSASEILAVLQAVPGVAAANVRELFISGEPPPPLPILGAPVAHWDGSKLVPATLLSLHAATLVLTEMTL